jgi:hypothetical protein
MAQGQKTSRILAWTFLSESQQKNGNSIKKIFFLANYFLDFVTRFQLSEIMIVNFNFVF